MSNKEYKIEVIDAPTNKVVEENKDDKSWWYQKTGLVIKKFDKQDKLEKRIQKVLGRPNRR